MILYTACECCSIRRVENCHTLVHQIWSYFVFNFDEVRSFLRSDTLVATAREQGVKTTTFYT